MATKNLLGQQLGAYRIESILGNGGLATVYRARNSQGVTVALKVLFPPPGVGAEILARFEREARTGARLNHPAIVRVFEVGQAGGHAFMAMELVEGQTLADRLARVGRLDGATAAGIAWQIADALHYAHSQGVIHRDVKPSNILLASIPEVAGNTGAERALLTDFGVALALDDPALTRTGYIVGSPAYMAPEQAAGQKPVDARADLYSLGVVLYQMVTGRRPFQGTTPQVLHAHVYDAPLPPSQVANVSAAVETIILRAMAKDVSRRFQTGAEMAQALARLGHQAVTKTHTPVIAIQRSNLKSENPFFYGGAVPLELFYGRWEILNTIVNRVGSRSAQSVSLVGERRMGKSSLLNYLKARADQHFSADIILVYLDLMKAYCHSRAGLMQAMRRQLSRAWREPWPAGDDGDLIAFDFALEELQAGGLRLLLCLDEIENLTRRAAEFNDVLEDWRASAQVGQMAMITASAQPLADLCATGGLTSPFYNIFSQHWLGLLPPDEWQALVTENMNASEDDLAFVEKVAGGQPFFTQMAASYLWEAKARGKVDYPQLYQELWFQVQPHLRYLWRKLTADEQRILRQLVNSERFSPNSRLLAALERRGIVRQQRPFSDLFAEMIAAGYLDD